MTKKRRGIITKALDRLDRRRRDPLEVVLTFRMNFGEGPADALTLVDGRRVPLVGSVFENRDRIAREFVRLMVKAGTLRTGAMGRLLGRRARKPSK